jgi:peptidoglycan/xylan/chitin deacetylase (PgdA/CDA1 family)
MYHRVYDAPQDPLHLNVTPAHFAEQMEVLAGMGRPVVPLLDLLTRSPHPRTVITFDDGYLDNFDNAVPVMARYGLPASFFIVASTIEAPCGEFWWDRIEHVMFDGDLPVPSLVLTTADGVKHVDVSTPEARHDAFVTCNALMVGLTPAGQQDLLAQIVDQSGVTPEACDRHRRAEATRLRSYANDPLVDLGAHTIDHCVLRTLEDRESQRQIAGAREILHRVLRENPRTMAYPFGGRLAVGGREFAFARQAGFDIACVTRPDTVRPGSNPFTVPRLAVPDLDGAAFEELVTTFASR